MLLNLMLLKGACLKLVENRSKWKFGTIEGQTLDSMSFQNAKTQKRFGN